MKVRLERNKVHQKYLLKDGSQVGGASSIAKLGDSYEGLIYWAWDLGRQGKDYRKVRDSAADSGTIAHFLVDCHLKNNEPDLREFNQPEIDLATISFKKFLDFWTKEKLSVIAIERQMVSERYKFGGTADLVALDENNKRVMLDWKSSKKLYKSHLWQLAGYSLLWNENNPKELLDRYAIIRIGREAGDNFEPHWRTQEEIDKCMNIFKAQAFLFNAVKDNS